VGKEPLTLLSSYGELRRVAADHHFGRPVAKLAHIPNMLVRDWVDTPRGKCYGTCLSHAGAVDGLHIRVAYRRDHQLPLGAPNLGAGKSANVSRDYTNNSPFTVERALRKLIHGTWQERTAS